MVRPDLYFASRETAYVRRTQFDWAKAGRSDCHRNDGGFDLRRHPSHVPLFPRCCFSWRSLPPWDSNCLSVTRKTARLRGGRAASSAGAGAAYVSADEQSAIETAAKEFKVPDSLRNRLVALRATGSAESARSRRGSAFRSRSRKRRCANQPCSSTAGNAACRSSSRRTMPARRLMPSRAR